MQIKLNTSLGNITLMLAAEKAPLTVANFVQYVKDGHYNNTVFHRVIDGFMIQGGGFTQQGADLEQKQTREPIQNEAKMASEQGLKNNRYSIAMARTSAPHSASAQFFINTADNSFLDYPGQDGFGYCVFGEVIEGKEVVDKIGKTKTGRLGFYADVPVEPVVILEAQLVTAAEVA